MSSQAAARAGVWSAVDIILRQVVSFTVSIVLARLLAPADFGLIALLGFFIGLSVVFVQGGLSLALVQRQQTSHDEENAVFWVNLLASCGFAALLIAIAPLVARFYGQPLLIELMYVAALLVILSALGAVQTALLTRNLQFSQLTKAGLASSLISGGLGVAAAILGYGVWALAIQAVAMAAVGSLSLWWLSEWRPKLQVKWSAIKDLYGFGFYISLSSTLEIIYSQGFALIIGKLFGVRDLGFLNRAYGVQALPTGVLSSIIARTALPFFSRRAEDPVALLQAFKRCLGLVMLLSLPMMAGLAVLSRELVVSLFGEKWLPAAPLITVMALGGILMPLHVLNLQLLIARGDSRHFLKLEIYKKLIGVCCLGAGAFHSVEAVVWGGVLFSFIALAINARPTADALGYGMWAQLRDLWDIAAATLFMSLLVLALKDAFAWSPLVGLLALSTVGAVAFTAFGLLLRLPNFREGLAVVQLVIRRKGEPGAGLADRIMD
jgi:O-antigen/teichoic acid export membrane protein